MRDNTDPLTLKLSLREKCAYGMGDFGSNLMLCIGTLYLLKFYTDELRDNYTCQDCGCEWKYRL